MSFSEMIKWMLWKHGGIEVFEPDPYVEGRIGNWKLSSTELTRDIRTRGSFKVRCTFFVMLEKVDPHEFRTARMLDNGAVDRLASAFLSTVVESYHAHTGFFAYKFTPHGAPVCYRYHYVLDDFGQPIVDFDPNACELVDKCKSIPFTRFGCRVWLVSIKEKDVMACIQENYAMLTDAQRTQARKSSDYKFAEAVSAICALKKQSEHERYVANALLDNSYSNEDLVITVKGVHGHAVISWRLKNKNAGRIKGFRLGVDIGLRGTQIIDHRTDGQIVENVPSGEIWNYKMYVDEKPDDDIRFQIRIPSIEEQKQIFQTMLDIEGIRKRLRGPNTKSSFEKILDRAKLLLGELRDYRAVRQTLLSEAAGIPDEQDRNAQEANINYVMNKLSGNMPL